MNAVGPEQAQAAYDCWHSHKDVDIGADAPWHRLLRRYLQPAVDLAVPRALEVACGRGGFACWLARQTPRPAEIVAADFSHTAVEMSARFAAEHEICGIRWQQADIQQLPFPAETFSTIFCCETIEHVPDPAQAVRELGRVLRPGGRLFLTVPNYLGTMGLYRGYLRLRGRRFTEVGQPINNFTWLPQTLRWVRAAGLVVGVTASVGHYLPFPGRPAFRLFWLDHLGPLTKYFGLHSLIVAGKT